MTSNCNIHCILHICPGQQNRFFVCPGFEPSLVAKEITIWRHQLTSISNEYCRYCYHLFFLWFLRFSLWTAEMEIFACMHRLHRRVFFQTCISPSFPNTMAVLISWKDFAVRVYEVVFRVMWQQRLEFPWLFILEVFEAIKLLPEQFLWHLNNFYLIVMFVGVERAPIFFWILL